MSWPIAFIVGILFGVGVLHVLQRDLIKLVLGFSLMLGAANLFVFTCGTLAGERAPYVSKAVKASDPVPQALILTAIAIGFATTALLISFVLLISQRFQTLNADDVSDLEG